MVFFAGWVAVYKSGINSLAIQSEDTIPAMFLPVTIIKEGTLYADSHYRMILQKYPNPNDKDFQKGSVPYYFKQVGSHYVSAFPVMAGILSIPVYFFPVILGMPVTWENLIVLSHLSASLIVALSGGFMYLLLKKFTGEKKSLLLTFVYLFGTVNYALLSQSLWQHGSVELFTILSLIFLFRQPTLSAKDLLLTGLFAGLAVLSRPTAAILIPYLLLLVIYIRNKQALDSGVSISHIAKWFIDCLPVMLGIIPVLLFFICYNAVYFGNISNQGYASQVSVNWLTPFPIGFLGLWLSPSKGLLVYSPVFIFSLIGFYMALKNKGWKESFNEIVFISIVITHTILLGAWKHWYGGYSFGYRMASDIIPFLMLLIVPYINSALFIRTKKIFAGAIVISALFELMGLAFFDGIWHGTYDRGFWNQWWLWSIKNSEFVFNMRRILLKLAL